MTAILPAHSTSLTITIKLNHLEIYHYPKSKQLPSSHLPSETKALYYLPYVVLGNNQIWLALEPFAITRYSDGSWPLLRDIETKIQQTLRTEHSLTDISLVLSGYYTKLEEARQTRTDIAIRGLQQTDFLIRPFTYGSTKVEARSDASTDFWGEKKASPTQSIPVQKPKAKPSFWDN